MKRAAAILAIAVLVVLSTSVVAATETTEIDYNHGLADESSINEFEGTGSTSTDLEQIDATITIADSKSDVGLAWTDTRKTDAGNEFLRIEYDEDIERTVRIWIPAEYIRPYEREAQESLTSDHTADLSPVRDRTYLEVKLYLDGEADVVIPLGRLSAGVEGMIAERTSTIDEALGSPFGIDEEWQYIEAATGHERVIELDLDPEVALVQYDGAGDPADPRWINAPEGDTRGAPVYYHVEGQNESMFLVVTSEEAIDIRFKEESSPADRVRGWIADARNGLESIPERIENILPSSPFLIGGA